MQVNTSTLNLKEESLIGLENERNKLNDELIQTKFTFSRDLSLINASLEKAELRFRSLEKKSLVEVDQARQRNKSLEKEIILLKKALKEEQLFFIKELAKSQNTIASLNEKVGTLSGKLFEISKQLSKTSKKLIQIEKKK